MGLLFVVVRGSGRGRRTGAVHVDQQHHLDFRGRIGEAAVADRVEEDLVVGRAGYVVLLAHEVIVDPLVALEAVHLAV